VAPEGAISIGGLVVLCTGIALFAISRAHAGRRHAEEALREATQRVANEARDRAAELQGVEGRLREKEQLLEQMSQERKRSDTRLREQLVRFALLDRITRAIGERQDVGSIFQAVVVTLEEELPVQLACICTYEAVTHELLVTSLGQRGAALPATPVRQGDRIRVDENELSRCVGGQLLYEPDIGGMAASLPERMRAAGMQSLVAAPLRLESKVFAVLIVARGAVSSFSSSDCEFLRQLSEHVALAANQAQLRSALQAAYDDLRRTQEAVMQQERLRALGEMASGAAHNINNAISPVMLYTESLLETEPGLSPRARDYLETIRRAIADVALMVTRMREFHRPREAQMSLAPVSLNELARQAADLTRARWSDVPQQRGAVVRMRMELEEDLPAVPGVAGEIREALINLIFNAVDAMPTGGTLTLRTGHSLAAEGEGPSCATIEVIDTGVGMDEDTRRRCLEPFFTTKGERGSGLGLAMVYGVVEHSGARIAIDSVPGLGTTVRLVFPAPSAAESESLPVPSAVSHLRILIVDDDPLLLKSLRDTLESDGHSIATAGGGREGIETFRTALESGQPFAVVITDLGMPYVDGRQVAAAVKEAAGATRVLMLTGWGQRLASRGEVPPCVDRLLSKPPKLRELRDALA
jgi:signal transduction histidine kinase